MSKLIKQMEMDALKQSFQGVRDLVLLSMSGIPAQTENQLRLGLRKKNIRLQMVKNSLMRKVFDGLGIRLSDKAWAGPTVLAWGSDSLAELSKELEALAKKNDKIKFKLAVADGQEVTFERALTMPTRAEALGRVVLLALSPASGLIGRALGAGGRLLGQVRALAERGESATAAPAAG
ncbi:MAG: 50S ribosomal protein L10 [Gemmataceae bacterium]|nr:50S ribosomal protein L10 [Gemmataceae bacterium]MDW8264465.1 50S ribosomal protein L10 [Gemmataceae bacterium]